MELWRAVAAGLLGLGGLILVLIAMAQARESTGGTSTRVAVTGLLSFTFVAVLTVLVATMLPASSVWVIVGLVALVVLALCTAG